MRTRVQGKRTARCGHAGCSKTIREGSRNFATGFCTAHQPVEQAAPKPERPGLRRVTIHLVPGCSSLASAHQVTLPAFPWEAA